MVEKNHVGLNLFIQQKLSDPKQLKRSFIKSLTLSLREPKPAETVGSQVVEKSDRGSNAFLCESGQVAEVQKPEVFNLLLGGGFKYFLFSPLAGEDSHFD